MNLKDRFNAASRRFAKPLSVLSAGMGAMAVTGQSHAVATVTALPSGAEDAFDNVTAYFGLMSAKAWPIAGTVIVGFIAIKLFKKFANKAT